MGRGVDLNQVYIPYWKWECYKNGMWEKVDRQKEAYMFKKAIDFTSRHDEYGKAMIEVSNVWKNSMLNFLTNKSINRKAYIGHCAVYYRLQIPEYIVRKAWKELTKQQQILANDQATKAIKLWEQKTKLNLTFQNGKEDVTKMGYQMKLQF